MKHLKHFWKSLSLILTLLGLLFFASDFMDIPQAVSGWRRVLGMIDQNTALWTFSMIAIIYIVWIDARPLFRIYFRDHHITARSVEIVANPFTVSGETLFRNVYRLPIVNTAKQNDIIRGVKPYIITAFNKREGHFDEANGASEVNIRSGETVYVYLGETITRKVVGASIDPMKNDPHPKQIESFLANEKMGHQFFFSESVSFALLVSSEPHSTPDYSIGVHLVGDGIKSKVFSIGITSVEGKMGLSLESVTGEFVESQSLINNAKETLR